MNMLLILIKKVIILIITSSKHDIKFACNVQTYILYAMFKHILYNVSNIQTDVWAILPLGISYSLASLVASLLIDFFCKWLILTSGTDMELRIKTHNSII